MSLTTQSDMHLHKALLIFVSSGICLHRIMLCLTVALI